MFLSCFIKISSPLDYPHKFLYMFSIISIMLFWKYRELLLYCTLYQNIVRKIHLLKKPAAGAARIRKWVYYVTVGK